MTETIDYSTTLNLPQTDFPMRAGLPEKEPLIVKRWQDMDLYRQLRDNAQRLVTEAVPPVTGLSKANTIV
mgnify:CR=1 FL=1